MKKQRKLLAQALGMMLSISAFTAPILAETPDPSSGTETPVTESGSASAKHGKKQEIEEPAGALGKDRAKEIALKDAGITAEEAGKVKARVSQKEDGTVIYKVSYTKDGIKTSYEIHALSGEILTKNSAEATEDTGGKKKGKGKKQEIAEPENAIGRDKAKETALNDAGIAADSAAKIKARVSQSDDGTVVYKVSFVKDGMKYSYRINAVSGEILEKTSTEANDLTTSATKSGKKAKETTAETTGESV